MSLQEPNVVLTEFFLSAIASVIFELVSQVEVIHLAVGPDQVQVALKNSDNLLYSSRNRILS